MTTKTTDKPETKTRRARKSDAEKLADLKAEQARISIRIAFTALKQAIDAGDHQAAFDAQPALYNALIDAGAVVKRGSDADPLEVGK